MPYASDAQRKYFNVNRAKLEKQGVDVDEWNQASKGMKLPARVKPTTHNSPPALSKFASNNASPSRPDIKQKFPAVSGEAATRMFERATKGVPGNVKHPPMRDTSRSENRAVPSKKVNAPAAVGGPGSKVPQGQNPRPLRTDNDPGSITARMKAMQRSGMISNRNMKRYGMRADDDDDDRAGWGR